MKFLTTRWGEIYNIDYFGIARESVNGLGLSNYGTSVYAALVLYDNAEAKEIIDFLGISKPRVYGALGHLEVMGLAVKTGPV